MATKSRDTCDTADGRSPRRPACVTAPEDGGSFSSPFRVVTRARGNERVLAFHGELDLAGAAPALESIAAAERARCSTVIDLGPLTFIDAAGLRVLLTAQRALRDRLTLLPGRGIVAHVLELTGLDETLPFIEPPSPSPAARGNEGSASRFVRPAQGG